MHITIIRSNHTKIKQLINIFLRYIYNLVVTKRFGRQQQNIVCKIQCEATNRGILQRCTQTFVPEKYHHHAEQNLVL